MNIQARFHDKKPECIEGIERLQIEYGGMTIEIAVVADLGLKIRLNEPLGASFSVLPDASNVLILSVRGRK